MAVKLTEFGIVIPGNAVETRNPLNHFNSCIQTFHLTEYQNKSGMKKDKLLLNPELCDSNFRIERVTIVKLQLQMQSVRCSL